MAVRLSADLLACQPVGLSISLKFQFRALCKSFALINAVAFLHKCCALSPHLLYSWRRARWHAVVAFVIKKVHRHICQFLWRQQHKQLY